MSIKIAQAIVPSPGLAFRDTQNSRAWLGKERHHRFEQSMSDVCGSYGCHLKRSNVSEDG